MGAELLDALRDVQLPEPVSAWPPAPGVWLVAALALALGVAAALWWRRRRRDVGRAALRELSVLQRDYLQRRSLDDLAAGLSALLRRVALARYGPRVTATLHGEDWIGFLASKARKPGFEAEIFRGIERAVYVGADPDACDEDGLLWIRAARRWIEVSS